MHIYWWLSHDSYYLHGSDSISLVLNSDSALNYVAICQKYVLLYSLDFRATIWMIFFQIEVFNHQQASDMYFPWKLRLVQEQAIKSIGGNHRVRLVWQKHHHLAALSQTTRSSCITLSSNTPLDVFLITCISYQVYFLNSAHMANAHYFIHLSFIYLSLGFEILDLLFLAKLTLCLKWSEMISNNLWDKISSISNLSRQPNNY